MKDTSLQLVEFSTIALSSRTGITMRQLLWWDDQGIFSPAFRKRSRIWDRQSATEVAVIASLIRKGLRIGKIRRILKAISQHLRIELKLMEHASPIPEIYLITDGLGVSVESDPGRVAKVLVNSFASAIVVNVTDAIRRLDTPRTCEKA